MLSWQARRDDIAKQAAERQKKEEKEASGEKDEGL